MVVYFEEVFSSLTCTIESNDRWDYCSRLILISFIFSSPQDTQFLHEDLFGVLDLDCQLSSHPIVQNVNHPDQITEIFDFISYSKVGDSAFVLFFTKTAFPVLSDWCAVKSYFESPEKSTIFRKMSQLTFSRGLTCNDEYQIFPKALLNLTFGSFKIMTQMFAHFLHENF